MTKRGLTVGLISDTHGLLRPQALEALRGSDFIVHAGDIGDSNILDTLSRIAPTTAVRGNNDRGPWASRIREIDVLDAGGSRICVIHDIAGFDVDPAAAGYRAVVSGHSHRSSIEWREGILFINPGSAGPRRFRLPVSVATLTISGDVIVPRIIALDV
jgi:putative phosphoesterase